MKSLSPKNQAWLYVITGVVAIVSALYFMTLGSSVIDWLILAMGVVLIGLGARDFWALRQGTDKPSKPE